MRALRRMIGWTAMLLAIAAVALLLWGLARGRPQDLPWTPLDLGAPVGLFTGRKLTALADDYPRCRGLLDQAGARYTMLPPRRGAGQCGYADAVRLDTGGARRIDVTPGGAAIACPVAAALAVWEWDVVQPAAQRHFGAAVTRIDQLGTYACRRIAGGDTRNWSEHATANAIDVAGFRLTNGMHVTVASDWRGDDAKAAFLHDVRDGACRLFATTLSPDYNAAHRDHFHLDQANRGTAGWRACR